MSTGPNGGSSHDACNTFSPNAPNDGQPAIDAKENTLFRELIGFKLITVSVAVNA
jgi:hypothetical protein